MSAKIKPIIDEVRAEFQKLYGERLVNLILFGSQARGEADAESDIDLMVVLKGPVNPSEEIARTGKITSEVSLKHNVVISCVYMSADRWVEDRSPLLLNVRREGVLV